MKLPGLNAGRTELYDWVIDCHQNIRNAWDEFPENHDRERNPRLLKNDKKITIFLFLFHQNCINLGIDHKFFEKNLYDPRVWNIFYLYNILPSFEDETLHSIPKMNLSYFKIFDRENLQEIKYLISYMKKCIYTVLPAEENDTEIFKISAFGNDLNFKI